MEQKSIKINANSEELSGKYEKFLTFEEVAKILKLSQKQVEKFARDGIIPSIRYNARVIRFKESDIINFIKNGVPRK